MKRKIFLLYHILPAIEEAPEESMFFYAYKSFCPGIKIQLFPL